MRRAPAIGVALALALACLPAARAGDGPGVRIAATWDEGLAEAARRNVPILVIIQKEGAAPFARLMAQPAFAATLNDRCIVIVMHRPGGHEPAKRMDPKEKVEVEYCPVYPSIQCKSHDDAYNIYAGRYDYKEPPAAFICRPDGAAILSGVEKMGAPVIQEKLNDAQTQLGEGVFQTEIDRLERKLQKGDEKLEGGKLGPARKVYEDELEGVTKPILKGMVEERIARLDARALEMIDEAKALEGKPRSDALHKIEREMRGRPPAEKAAAVIKELGL